MTCIKEPYGQDADGNRGIYVWDCEIDDDDTPEIEAQIEESITSGGIDDYFSTTEVVLINPHNEEDIVFTVNIAEYITRKRFNELTRE